MPVRKGWLPREGFTADVLIRIFKNTALNATLTLPLYILIQYTQGGQKLAISHEVALSRLKVLVYLGILRYLNNFLSTGALNNWTSSKYEWNKEVVVITGGSDGIGKMIARLLAEKGAKIAILDVQPLTFEPRTSPHSNSAPLSYANTTLVAPNIHFYSCDITSPEAVSTTASSIRSSLGNPTLLINNAGIAVGLPILSTTDASVQEVFDVNILSHFRLIREFVPAMVAANHGTVVTIASIASAVPAPQIVPYACTKSAAVALHEGLAAELRTRYDAPKVRTICVCPGWTRTKLTEGINHTSDFMFPWLHPETVAEKVFERIVSGRSGMVFVPEVAWNIGWVLRSLPSWWQVTVRNDGGKFVSPDMVARRHKEIESRKGSVAAGDAHVS
ncbi:MAG: hypothetical protein Q9218_005700 [Villophora microphyllina]